MNGTIFKGKKYGTYDVFWFSLQIFFWHISHSTMNSAGHYHKCTKVFMYRTLYSCHILIKLEFSWQIFKKSSSIKFHKNSSSGSRVAPREKTETWATDMVKLRVTFHNFANMPKTVCKYLVQNSPYWNLQISHWYNTDILSSEKLIHYKSKIWRAFLLLHYHKRYQVPMKCHHTHNKQPSQWAGKICKNNCTVHSPDPFYCSVYGSCSSY
jgi:hypothetical protein